MATSFFLVEFSTFGDLSFNVSPKDFMGCEGELNRDKLKKKKLFGVEVSILGSMASDST